MEQVHLYGRGSSVEDEVTDLLTEYYHCHVVRKREFGGEMNGDWSEGIQSRSGVHGDPADEVVPWQSMMAV